MLVTLAFLPCVCTASVDEQLLGSMNLVLNQNCCSGHLHATIFRERKWFLNNLCWKINRLGLLSSTDHIFQLFFLFWVFFFSFSGLLWLLWFIWKMAHGLAALSPFLHRERNQISLKENLCQVQRMDRRTTPSPSALRLALAFLAEWTHGKTGELLWHNSTHILLPKTWEI